MDIHRHARNYSRSTYSERTRHAKYRERTSIRSSVAFKASSSIRSSDNAKIAQKPKPPLTKRAVLCILEPLILSVGLRRFLFEIREVMTTLHTMAHSKRYKELVKLIDAKKVYSLTDAINLTKQTATTKFDGSVEIHMHLGIDPKKGEQQVRGTISLPHGTGKTLRVAAFVNSEKVKDAKEAGAELVGAEDLVDEISKTGKIEFDVAVATPDMMAKLAKIAKILGPKGLMPNPKTETVSQNVKKMIEELKKGKVSFKNDDTANLHIAIGKTSFSAEALLQNATTAIDAVHKAKPASSKGTYIQTVTLTSTMGPAIRSQVA